MSLFWPRHNYGFGPLTSYSAPRHHDHYTPFYRLFDDTFSELAKLQDEFNNQLGHKGSTSAVWAPKFDVKEAEDSYQLEGEFPGLDSKNIDIQFVDEHTLTIRGATEYHREEGQRPEPKRLAGSVASENKDAAAESADTAQASGANQESTDDSSKATNGHNTNTEIAPTPSNNQVSQTNKSTPTYWISERSTGTFQRSFQFPAQVDHENVRASLKGGLLKVFVPKVKPKEKNTKGRKVEIETVQE